MATLDPKSLALAAVPGDLEQAVVDAYRTGASVSWIVADVLKRTGILLARTAIVRCVAEYACDGIVRSAKAIADNEAALGADAEPDLLLYAGEVMTRALAVRMDAERL